MKQYASPDHFIDNCWDEIVAAYTHPSRFYHNLGHLRGMLKEMNSISESIKNPEIQLFALYYHDFVYKVPGKYNEHKSALAFQKRIGKTRFPHVPKVMELIEATKYHIKASDLTTNIFLDLDLSILGKSKAEYREYRLNIHKEFGRYPDFLFRRKRKKVLERFIDMDFIFKTDHFRNRYELRARENILGELAEIRSA
jgi:predicted metal-dependent HD superfamily phosphohydrolase